MRFSILQARFRRATLLKLKCFLLNPFSLHHGVAMKYDDSICDVRTVEPHTTKQRLNDDDPNSGARTIGAVRVNNITQRTLAQQNRGRQN
jgi:hypothetical protein